MRLDTDTGFQTYVQSLRRFESLQKEQELELARRYKGGDKRAGERLVNAHLKQVVSIARRYRGYGFRMSDLVSEGNIGLVLALHRFEPERGLRFMTYASYWVRARILAHILKGWSLVSLGTSPMQSKLFFRLQREKAKLSAEIGEGNPEISGRLAERFGCSEDRIRKMDYRMRMRDASLEAKVYRDGNVSVIDTLVSNSSSAEQSVAEDELRRVVSERVGELMKSLDEREQLICKARLLVHGERKSLSQLGEELGLSRERVRQLELRLKAKLRRRLREFEPVRRAA